MRNHKKIPEITWLKICSRVHFHQFTFITNFASKTSTEKGLYGTTFGYWHHIAPLVIYNRRNTAKRKKRVKETLDQCVDMMQDYERKHIWKSLAFNLHYCFVQSISLEFILKVAVKVIGTVYFLQAWINFWYVFKLSGAIWEGD